VSELQGNRELLPMTGIRGHAPGELCCCWIGDRAFVSAGSEGKVVRWGLNGRELSDELLLTHEQGVTALVQLDGETLAFGDARGAVYVAGASGAKPRRLASTAERGGVRQLIVFGERLIARLESGLVAWDVGPGAGGEPAWERSVVTVAATASPAGRLALALQAGGAEEIDVGSGEPVGPLPCPTPDRLLSLHFASTEDPEPEATVWIWPRGPILIDGPGRTTGIVNDPLEATTVSFRCRCVAYADIGHRLHVLPWNA
jgi:hypothetical protein